MFKDLLNNPASKLKHAVVQYFERTLGVSIFLGIIVCIIGAIYGGFGGLLIGLLVAALLIVLMCGRLYINTLDALARLEAIENIESIENDTGYVRKQLCDIHMPEPEIGALNVTTCSSCGRRYDSAKTKVCPLCGN